MMSQVTSGPGNTDEAKTLRQDLDAAIAEYGEQIPMLSELAEQLDLLARLEADPALAASMADAATADYEPNPEIFDLIDDNDPAGVEAALQSWEVNATHGEFDCTALYHAMSCMFGVSLPIVTLLLDKGADPSIGLGKLSNVLHGLGFGRCDDLDPAELSDVIKRCVSLGADLEQRSNKLKWTPLITAASEWNPVATEALLLAGADIHARSGDVDNVCFAGETAAAFAEGHDATLRVLTRYMTSN